MGTVASRTSAANSRQIDRYLKDAHTKQSTEIKLLLLGTGGSGKSTLARQMKVLKLDGFTADERKYYRLHVHSNLGSAVVELWQELLSRHYPHAPGVELDVKVVKDWHHQLSLHHDEVHPDVANAIDELLDDSRLAIMLGNYSEKFRFLPDSADYFFHHHRRICESTYDPTADDILRCRIATTAIHELLFDADGLRIRLIDVGGQRGQRKKWITQFDNVNGIIFVTGLTDYAKKMEEDQKTNRMKDSIAVFDEIIKVKIFKDSAILIFFNKKDLLASMLSSVPFVDCFTDYMGSNDYDTVTNKIKELFLARKPPEKEIYTHFTNATDTQNMNKVFQMTLSIIVKGNIERIGIN